MCLFVWSILLARFGSYSKFKDWRTQNRARVQIRRAPGTTRWFRQPHGMAACRPKLRTLGVLESVRFEVHPAASRTDDGSKHLTCFSHREYFRALTSSMSRHSQRLQTLADAPSNGGVTSAFAVGVGREQRLGGGDKLTECLNQSQGCPPSAPRRSQGMRTSLGGP